MSIKEIAKDKIKNSESKESFNSDFINQKNKQINDKAKNVLDLFNTINKAIQYINNNLNKGEFDYIENLTGDSIKALNSIEKTLFDKNNKSDLKTRIDLLKSDFEELNEAVKNKNLNKSKEIMNNRRMKDYDGISIMLGR
jgi:fructose-1,6-bisphosphatase